jgi:hypothetical protein
LGCFLLSTLGFALIASACESSVEQDCGKVGCGAPIEAADASLDARAEAASLANDASPDATLAVDAERADAGGECKRVPSASDQHWVVISHPFGKGGMKDNRYEVFGLSPAGVLAKTGSVFQLGVGLHGAVHFTPDGKVGFVAQDDGSLGIFSLAAGVPQVIEPALKPGFYVSDLAISNDGATLYVADGNTAENGGGLHQASIDCDGKLQNWKKLFSAKLPGWPVVLPDGDVVLTGTSVLGSGQAEDGHRMRLSQSQAVRRASTTLIAQDSIASWGTLFGASHVAYAYGNDLLVGDKLAFVATPSAGAPLGKVQTLTLTAPNMLLASPFGNALLVGTVTPDDLYRISFDAGRADAFKLEGKVTYAFGRPEIPAAGAVVARGSNKGMALIGEPSAIRQMRFDASGSVTDVAKLELPPGEENIVGILGVTP